jgi:hypothetical protein
MEKINWELDEGQIIIYKEDKIEEGIYLTKQEYKLFKKMKNGKLYSKNSLIYHVYDYKKIEKNDANNIKALIWRLNLKIKPIGRIVNHYTWGYQFKFSIRERKQEKINK